MSSIYLSSSKQIVNIFWAAANNNNSSSNIVTNQKEEEEEEVEKKNKTTIIFTLKFRSKISFQEVWGICKFEENNEK